MFDELHHIHSRVWISWSTGREKTTIDDSSGHTVFFLSDFLTPNNDLEDTEEGEIDPSSLTDIFEFSKTVQRTLCHHPSKNIVICAGHNESKFTNIALLLGGYLILGHDVELKQLESAFQHMSKRFSDFAEELTLHDCWRALIQARKLGWLDFSAGALLGAHSERGRPIDMLEYMHYDGKLNGGLHMVIPDKLLVFPCPQDLHDGKTWMDVGGERAFSPSFYADLLSDFDVQLVIRTRECSYDTSAFEERGIEVEDLDFSGESCLSPLRRIDRFLTLVRNVPGAVAVHGGEGCGLGSAGALVAALLINVYGFIAADAIAWLQMASPERVDGPDRRLLRDQEGPVRRLRGTMPALPVLLDPDDAAAGVGVGLDLGCGLGGACCASPALMARSRSSPGLPSLASADEDAYDDLLA
jgi:hypothetical protein